MAELSWSGALSSPANALQARASARQTAAACCALGALQVLAGLAGFPGIFSGVAHLFLGYAVLKHASRSAAVALFAEASLSFFVGLTSGTLGGKDFLNLVPAVAIMVIGLQAIRSTYAYHRHMGSRAAPGNVFKKSSAAAAYVFLTHFLLILGGWLAGLPLDPWHPVLVAFVLYAPTLTVLAAALEGVLPLTRGLPFTEIPDAAGGSPAPLTGG